MRGRGMREGARGRANRERNRAKCKKYYRNRVKNEKEDGDDP